MALLDTSIVNAALPVIQGEIGATTSEGTWLGTSYLVAEIVIMPLTAWFERLFGLRRVLLTGSVIFTFFSVVCGFSTDLTTMIIGRVGQGISGGVMIPTGMTILAKRLPASQQSVGMAIFAAAALLGPIVGPVLGGWITENASWHYAFFINVPICAVLVALILVAVTPDKPENGAKAEADWWGVVGMMVGLGALTVLLEEGHREQWFESSLIWKLAIAAATGFALVAVGQKLSRTPVLKLSLLRDRGLSSVLFLMSVTGVVLFSTLFTVPQFLALIAGYNAFQAGIVLTTAGAVSIIGAMLYPIVVARVDVRLIVATAFCFTGSGSFLASRLTAESAGWHFVPGLILMGIGTTFSAIPLQQGALSCVEVEDSAESTSMFNIARNLGGSIGLAVLASLLDVRLEFHHWRLHETIGANDPSTWERLSGMSAQFGGGPEGLDAAYRSLDAQIMLEALVMSFEDVFVTLSLASFLSLPLVLLLKQIDPERAQGMAH
ncbi:MAG: DHA2 family efflux MFS transporter permease subunit [Novosphingobium sp.]|nr:DHA2 family efflux MFS transporter permease subunit [Novosphingobium sp.]